MPPTEDREGGFSLIEVLIALAIVAVSLVAIGAVVAILLANRDRKRWEVVPTENGSNRT